MRARVVRQVADWRGTDLDEVDGRAGTEAAAVRWISDGPEPKGHSAAAEAPGEASVKPSTSSGTSEPGR